MSIADSQERFLILSLVNPYRPHATGGSEDVQRRMRALIGHGCDTSLIAIDDASQCALPNPQSQTPLPVFSRVFERRRNARTWMRCLQEPMPTATRHNQEIVSLLRQMDLSQTTVVVEGLQMASYLSPLRKMRARRIVLRPLNLESDYFAQLAKSLPPPKRWACRIISRQYAALERRVLPLLDQIWFISKREMDVCMTRHPGTRDLACHVPPIASTPPTRWTPPQRNDRTTLFRYFGDLSVGINIAGIKWFISDVWPQVRRELPDAQLELAGQGSQNITGDCVRGVGFVPDIDSFIRGADMMILPARHGAGVKLSTIDALSLGVPVAATEIAMQGVDIDHDLMPHMARDASDMVRACLEARKDSAKAIERAAQIAQYVEDNHSQSAVLRTMLEKVT